VCTADEHTDLREDYQRPDAARTTAATALRRHGNTGTASATDTNADNLVINCYQQTCPNE